MDVRIKFNKTRDMIYISHLDLLRTFNRMLMRTSLKLSYSQGFNPHVLLNFAQPSSVGMETKCDCADVSFDGDYELSEIKEKLINSAPDGIEITDVTTDKNPPFNKVAYATYTVLIETDVKEEEIKSFFSLDEIFVEKKTKKGIKDVDIKPLIYEHLVLSEYDRIILKLRLASGSTNNLNPALIIKAMEKYINNFSFKYYHIVRESLISEENIVY